MILKKRGFTLLELQMASVLMIVVLIATGVIFYFALASIRYLHDAAMVFSNANSAIKALTGEIIVSNCYGNAQGGGPDFKPVYGSGTDLYLRQTSQIHGAATIAGDFANDDSLVFFTDQNSETFIDEMNVDISIGGGPVTPWGDGTYTVAHHITDFSFEHIAYNCVAVKVTATGDVQAPLPDANGDFEVNKITIGKMITLRCAPATRL